MRIDSVTADELDAISRNSQYDEPDLAIYFMQPNAVNFNEVETNFRTYYGNQILGFPAKYMVCLLYTSPSPRDKRQSRMPSSA